METTVSKWKIHTSMHEDDITLDFEGFEPSEVHDITSYYVCAQCYSQLVAFNVPGQRIYIIVCSYCTKNIEDLGMVSKRTVEIRESWGREVYRTVITNLKDLYPSIQPVKQTAEQILADLGYKEN